MYLVLLTSTEQKIMGFTFSGPLCRWTSDNSEQRWRAGAARRLTVTDWGAWTTACVRPFWIRRRQFFETYRNVVVKRVTVIELGVNDSGARCCGTELRADRIQWSWRNLMTAVLAERWHLLWKDEVSIKDETGVASRVGAVERWVVYAGELTPQKPLLSVTCCNTVVLSWLRTICVLLLAAIVRVNVFKFRVHVH